MESTNREVREAAFKNLYKTYEGLKIRLQAHYQLM